MCCKLSFLLENGQRPVPTFTFGRGLIPPLSAGSLALAPVIRGKHPMVHFGIGPTAIQTWFSKMPDSLGPPPSLAHLGGNARARVVSPLLVLALACSPLAAQEPAPAAGTINFPTSGTPEAQEEFITGVLALHSFWYDEARDRFIKAQRLDPGFGMAYWGEAMSWDNALGTLAGF